MTLAVGEQLCVDSPLEKGVASEIILGNHFPPGPYSRSERYDLARAWWEENKAELRRRAAQLPR